MRKEPLSMLEQARLVDALAGRCVMRDGKIADETTLVLTAEEAGDLTQLANRLFHMAPYQNKIRNLVMK